MNKKCPPAPIMDDVFYCSLSMEQGLPEGVSWGGVEMKACI